MNTMSFFMAHFGRHVLPEAQITGDDYRDAQRVLTASHPKPGKSPSRFNAGTVLVVRAGGSLMNNGFAFPGVATGAEGARAILAREILEGLREPTLLVACTNALVAADDLRVTYDPRRCCIVQPGGALLFDAVVIRRAIAVVEPLPEGTPEAAAAKLAGIRIKSPSRKQPKPKGGSHA